MAAQERIGLAEARSCPEARGLPRIKTDTGRDDTRPASMPVKYYWVTPSPRRGEMADLISSQQIGDYNVEGLAIRKCLWIGISPLERVKDLERGVKEIDGWLDEDGAILGIAE